MKKWGLGAVALALTMVTQAALAIPVPTIEVHPWLAPNVFGSPNWAPAVANAITALKTGASSAGTPGTPAYYEEQTTSVSSAEVVVTGFPSWRGLVDPGTEFGPAFASELGNRMHFALVIDGNGGKFSISQLGFGATSTDPFAGLAFGFGTGSYGYSSDYQGVLYGGDGAFGGGDDTYVTAGLATTLVDGLIGRGSGNSFAAYCPGCDLSAQQAALDAVAAYPDYPFDFIGTYTLVADDEIIASGSGTFHITSSVPEPGTLALFGAGLLAFGGVRLTQRRHKAQRA